jgi:hypothetical protein
MPVLGIAFANLVFSPCFTAQIKKINLADLKVDT